MSMSPEYKAQWARDNKDAMHVARQKWIANNPEKRKKAALDYYYRNKDKAADYALRYYSTHKEERAVYADSYRRAHLPNAAARERLRHIKKKTATPAWVDQDALLDIYKEAEYFQMEVDHEIPLNHPLVCGLHVPWNLQLLTKSANCKKNNKFSIGEHKCL